MFVNDDTNKQSPEVVLDAFRIARDSKFSAKRQKYGRKTSYCTSLVLQDKALKPFTRCFNSAIITGNEQNRAETLKPLVNFQKRVHQLVFLPITRYSLKNPRAIRVAERFSDKTEQKLNVVGPKAGSTCPPPNQKDLFGSRRKPAAVPVE